MQPIRVQTSQGNIEEALLHIAEVDADIADLRAAAVHKRDPMHTMLFDDNGGLLSANAAALQAFARHSPGQLLASAALQSSNDQQLFFKTVSTVRPKLWLRTRPGSSYLSFVAHCLVHMKVCDFSPARRRDGQLAELANVSCNKAYCHKVPYAKGAEASLIHGTMHANVDGPLPQLWSADADQEANQHITMKVLFDEGVYPGTVSFLMQCWTHLVI